MLEQEDKGIMIPLTPCLNILCLEKLDIMKMPNNKTSKLPYALVPFKLCFPLWIILTQVYECVCLCVVERVREANENVTNHPLHVISSLTQYNYITRSV